MTRWRLFWFAGIVPALAALDLWREAEDIKHGRDHSDGTTFSACNRWLVETVPGGRRAFPVLLAILFVWYAGHIDEHLDTQRARW